MITGYLRKWGGIQAYGLGAFFAGENLMRVLK